MRAGEKKALVVLALVLLSWRLFEEAQIEDAFLEFVTVGALPWTDKTLSPDQVLILTAALFSLSLLLIFRRELVRSFRIRAVDTTSAAVGTRSTSITLRRQRHKGVRIPMPSLRIRDKKLPELYLPSIMPAIWRFIDWEMRQFVRLYRALVKMYRFLKVLAIKGWKRVRSCVAALWRWLEPQIRTFDKWLEKKARKHRFASEVIEVLDDCWRTVRLYMRRWTS